MAHITIFYPKKVKNGSTGKVVALSLYDDEGNWITIHFKDSAALERFGKDIDQVIKI